MEWIEKIWGADSSRQIRVGDEVRSERSPIGTALVASIISRAHKPTGETVYTLALHDIDFDVARIIG